MHDDDAMVGRLLSRREVMALLGMSGMTFNAGPLRAQTPGAPGAMLPACVVQPEQTEGPYFVDKMLDRSDIRVDPATRAVDPFLPAERVSAGDAVAAFTNGSSFVNNSDPDVGSIEPGKAADVVVLDRNIFEPGAGPIGDAEVLFTLAGGDVIYERA